MPYIGAPPPDRILTSEDIEAGAVEMSDISWKNQPDNENISGTIDSFTVKLAEKFTLTGDIDISKDLVLTKLADDGEALVLTTDASSRTIEGSGTISSNTFAQVPNAKLEGMTGVLDNTVQDNITRLGTVTSGTIGSAVTGEIGSAVTGGSGLTSLTGSCYFIMSATNTWTTLSDNDLLAFNVIEIDDDNRCNTTGSKFTAPATGIYQFGATIHLKGNNDSFYGFYINGSNLDFTSDTTWGTHFKPDDEAALSFSIPLKLNINDYVTVQAPRGGDWYGQHSFWWGYRLR